METITFGDKRLYLNRRLKQQGCKYNNIAYIVHTSGTTRIGDIGLSVKVPHAAVCSNVEQIKYVKLIINRRTRMGLKSCVGILQTPPTFDPFFIELLMPMALENSTLVIPATRNLGSAIKDAKISFLSMTPSAFFHLLDSEEQACVLSGNSSVRDLILGGEAFPNLRGMLSPGIRVWNIYGVTECSVWASMHLVNIDEWPVPIGEFFGDVKFQFQNDELFISKRNCIVENSPTEMHPTGDVFDTTQNGLVFKGRKDDMIKRFGRRIFLSEIEMVICSHPLIKHCKYFFTYF